MFLVYHVLFSQLFKLFNTSLGRLRKHLSYSHFGIIPYKKTLHVVLDTASRHFVPDSLV